ncbi:MAG TPA: NF038122 family metalloprotease, partial [Sphingomonas sp.]|nr:NF038122 family metalloprotease [Sphingomonas sp.]
GAGAVLDFTPGTASYFSVDGGLTALFGNKFSTGSFNGDGRQASHWKDAIGCSGQLGIMDPTFCYGQMGDVTALDLAAFDAIGWNLQRDVILNPAYHRTTAQIYASFVPEPASWAMMLGGFGLVGGALRRRRTSVAFG